MLLDLFGVGSEEIVVDGDEEVGGIGEMVEVGLKDWDMIVLEVA